MRQRTATPTAKHLYAALKKRGIQAILEYHDGKKCVDIALPNSKLYLEIDGSLHYTNPYQIIRDIRRDHCSEKKNGYDTIRIPNTEIEKHCEEIADALVIVIEKRKSTHH